MMADLRYGNNARKFDELAALGLKPLEAIRAATMKAATAVGLENQIGLLKNGHRADIIGVEGNPLDDLNALQKVTFVMKAGEPLNRDPL